MQQRAVIWITGAFCTLSTAGIEAISGLIPIHLHLKKLYAELMMVEIYYIYYPYQLKDFLNEELALV